MTRQLIEIPQAAPWYDQFIGAWLVTGPLTFLVDVGPAATAAALAASLEARGVERIDYILITHIHLDHAGALAEILARYPMAKAVCCEKAVPLLIDPAKLWAGSLSVLGKTAELYGPPGPAPAEKLIPHTQCRIPGLRVIETPGHAVHHLSYTYDGLLFVGEAGGNCFPVGGSHYLRPATPPRFFMTVYLESLAKLLALPRHILCYAHFGETDDSHDGLERFKAQLLRWEQILGAELAGGTLPPAAELLEVLLAKDPELAIFPSLAPDIQERERGFLINSINGFVGFLTAPK